MHSCAYTGLVDVEWDVGKAEANFRKHRIAFEDAAAVLYDGHALMIMNHRSDGPRLVRVGADSLGRILVVVHTLRGSRHRLISARRATTKERRLYSEGV